MDILSDIKIPLTAKNVRSMAHASFADSFDKLCRAATDFKWLEFDVNDPQSIGTDRAVYRHLKRSEHNRLLVVGWYAPGPADEKPVDRVAAHVHADPAEVRFYRIVQSKDGSRSLEDVNSTSAVDFDPPFCDVGDGRGDHRAGHRVTALIEWFFLDAGLIPELARPEGDPTKFTRNFRQASMWVGNEGNQPGELLTRRSSVANMQVEEKESIPVRPKRSSTVSYRIAASDDFRSPPVIKRSATDTAQVKRQREEDALVRPTKHRRTLSEQITPLNLSRLKGSSNPPSPRTPTLNDAERINRALGLRIIHLYDQYRDLKSSFDDTENKQRELQKGLVEANNTVSRVEARSKELEVEVKSLRARLRQAEDESAKLRSEILGSGRDSMERKTRGRP